MKKSLALALLLVFVLASFAFAVPKVVWFVFTPKPDMKFSSVFVSGEFNGWKPAAPGWQMWKANATQWAFKAMLEPGKYQYKYVMDGTTWVQDEHNPLKQDDGVSGAFNSIKVVQ